jgi:hydroxyacylglutathione hydrolase
LKPKKSYTFRLRFETQGISKMKIKQFVFNPFMENTYLVYNESGETMVVDPGCSNSAEEDRISNFIKENNLFVKLVVNTHLHIDHVFGNVFFEKKYGIKTLANLADEFWLDNLDLQARMFGVSAAKEKPSIGGYLNEGDVINLGTETFFVFEVPGHSPGSIVFYNSLQGCIFSGDVLFEGSIGRADLKGGDYESLINGIQKKLLVLPDETIVYCGHGGSTTIGHEKQYNPYL